MNAKAKTGEYTPFSPPACVDDADPKKGNGVLLAASAEGAHSPPFQILRACPAKRGGQAGIVGSVWVRVAGVVDLQLKIIARRDRRLFVAPPCSSFKDRAGKTRYVRRAKFVDKDLFEQIAEAALAAYEERLALDGRRVPPPLKPRERPPNRVRELLDAAAEYVDPVETPKAVAWTLLDIMDDKSAAVRDRLNAARQLCHIFGIQTCQFVAACRCDIQIAKLTGVAPPA